MKGLSKFEEAGPLYVNKPFRKAEHGDKRPIHEQSFDSQTGFEPSGFRHPRGTNRAGRRRLWKTMATREQRMAARELRWPPLRLKPKVSE